MANVTRQTLTFLDGALVVSVTSDSVTGVITQVSWTNTGPAAQVLISMLNKADISFTIAAGASGSRNINKNQGYTLADTSVRVAINLK